MQAAVKAGVEMDELQWATLVGTLLSRDAPHAQIRATLNLALPKDGKIIPLEPEEGNDLTPEEAEAFYEEGDESSYQKATEELFFFDDIMNDEVMDDDKKDNDKTEEVKSSRDALLEISLESLRGRVTSDNEKASRYLCHFAILLFLERLEEVRTVRSRLLRHGAKKLVDFGLAFDELQVEYTGKFNQFTRTEPLPGFPETGFQEVRFRFTRRVQWDDLRIGDGDCVQIAASDKGSVGRSVGDGVISKINQEGRSMKVMLNGRMPEDCMEPTKRFRLDQGSIFAVFERQMTALLRLARMRKLPPLLELLVAGDTGQVDECRNPDDPIPEDKRNSLCARLARDDSVTSNDGKLVDKLTNEVRAMDNLNASQKEAIRDAVTKRCTIVQGPPGTGKTHVSVEILRLWSQTMGRKPILATSDSNVAVDNIAMGLQAKGVRVVRVGRIEKIRGQIEGLTLESQLEKEKLDRSEQLGHSYNEWELEPDTWQDAGWQASKRKRQFQDDKEAKMRLLKDAEVICSTTISCGNELLRAFNFDAILVDEVAQATETSTIVPLVLRGAKQLVLCGDHCQLPPGVVSKEAELRGLSLSIYSRLVDCGLKPHFLNTQYRSHPKLAEFSAQVFYKGNLKTGITADQRPVPEGFSWPNPKVPVVFYNIQVPEEKDGESKANPAEAEMVLDVVLEMIQSGKFTLEDIGIVTPYKGQVRVLRRLLNAKIPELRQAKEEEIAEKAKGKAKGKGKGGGEEGKKKPTLECFSVDNFQGREKEVMIFSAVRSNDIVSVGFLKDWRRLNVMITRARRGLVIVGDQDTLWHDPYWQQWLEWAKENGCYDEKFNSRKYTGNTARALSKLWNDSNIQNANKGYAMLAKALEEGKAGNVDSSEESPSKKQKTTDGKSWQDWKSSSWSSWDNNDKSWNSSKGQKNSWEGQSSWNNQDAWK
eukprot:gnl/MRDRNA2_/MRDRNA2_60986_c0_seq1.p1 gnl/MRDRNA2_/MRDRNA2_60986_c0~~gnl/MRDRNA2_/MRDRNA2_60986_c0_seq1.p1  ORF type:complete len:1028 (-),score=238.27 gnl/MRDRNA2_/MRDRNA2_60986_c0_seq1:74-2872(-)